MKYYLNEKIFGTASFLNLLLRQVKFSVRGMFPTLSLLLAVLVAYTSIQAQSITEIITDYQGYWKTSSTAINPVKPNNSHNLLSFSFSGVRYSTGVNDGLLTSRGQSFVAGDYKAFPVQSIGGTVTGNTKVGVGAMYDGVAVGASSQPPPNNLAQYLTDGSKGLNIGTCVANLPDGDLFFSIGNINPSSIGDGIPDVVITQIAEPSNSNFDRYEFTDVNGNRVGNYKDIVLTTITSIGTWTADFYEAHNNPMTLSAGYTNTDRNLRLWAADFSAFGISSADISSIAYFKIALNGNSDVAFVAYNNNAINFSSVLPMQLSSLLASTVREGIQLSWQTSSETNTERFTIETSSDGINFAELADKTAAGFSATPVKYSYLHRSPVTGKNYYRLKQIDQDGRFKYTRIVEADIAQTNTLRLHPNPATNKLVVSHNTAKGNEQLQILTTRGIVVLQSILHAGTTETRFEQLHLARGLYFVVIAGAKQKFTRPLMIQ